MEKELHNKVKISKIIVLFISIIFIFSLIMFYTTNLNMISKSPEKIVLPFIIVSLILHLIEFKIIKINYFDFSFWFILLSYIFMFGLVFRECFELKYTLEWNPIRFFNNGDLYKAYFYSLICINCFSLGYFMFSNFDSRNFSYEKMDMNNKNNQMYYMGILLLIIGGFCTIVNDIKIINVMRVYNSYAQFSMVHSSGIIDDLAFLLLPGLFLMIFSGVPSKKKIKTIIFALLIYFSVVMMLTGSRKIKLFSIVSLFILYYFCFKKDKQKIGIKKIFKILIYAFLSILLLNILIVIRDYRFNLSEVLPHFIDNVLNFNLISNLFGEVFSETGLTLLSVASIIGTVPSVFPYMYGKTFLITIPSCLPIGWLFGDFFEQASSTSVINKYTKLPLGSSLFGDLYWNWGFWGGIFAALIFGIIFAKLFSVSKNKYERLNYALYFSYFSQLLVLVRAEFFDIFRPLFYILIISIILKKTKFPLRK